MRIDAPQRNSDWLRRAAAIASAIGVSSVLHAASSRAGSSIDYSAQGGPITRQLPEKGRIQSVVNCCGRRDAGIAAV